MRDQRLKKYFNLDNAELKEERIVKKKVFKDKDANISSNALNSFFNLFTPTPIEENVIKTPINTAFKWKVAEVKQPQEVMVEKVEEPKEEIKEVKEEVVIANPVEDTSKYVHFFEAEKRIPKKREGQDPKTHSDLYTDENPKGTIKGLGFKDTATAKASVSKIENSGKTHAHKIQAAIAMEQRARVMGKTAEAAIYRAYIEKMKKKTKEMQKSKKEDIEEKAPNTADAMKRFKSGKAGFTDKAHLKAKGLIPRADGTKKVSDKYKEELEATNAKLDALKDFMSKLESFEVALGKATEPAQPKVIKEVQEKIIYREFDPANVKPKVVWKQPVQEVVEPEVPEVIQEAQPKVEDTKDFVSRIAGQMSKSIDREKANMKPVTKLNEQKSALDQLREEFQVFKQNVITQLASLGGGGSVNLLDLDDVDISSLGNGKFLVYNSTTEKLEFTDQVDGN